MKKILEPSEIQTWNEFYEKYAHCAAEKVLEKIWNVKRFNGNGLNLDRDEIYDLSPVIVVKGLRFLSCSNTRVSDLSVIMHLPQLEHFGCRDCPLTTPPFETANQGISAIRRWFNEREKNGITNLIEARLLIVGQGGAGKTTLRYKLLDVNSEMPQADATTRGIDIETLSFTSDKGNFTLHIWDFGGQNIQHFAHSFFLSDNVVYSLLTCEREQNDHMSYWLHTIELLGKSSPILIIQNEKQGHTEELKDKAGINERFGVDRMLQFHKLDLSQAVTDERFRKLKREIFHLAEGLPHVGREVLKSFQRVREGLLIREEQYITFKEFEKECQKHNIEDLALMRDYARSFHFLGICLYFEEDPFLENYVFLRPKWIIDAVFELLYEGERLRQKPVISENDTKVIWSGELYRGMRGHLLRLMCNFEMCYQIKDSSQYLIPQLLPVRTYKLESEANDTKVFFRYKFLPKGFLTRLTCRLHEKINNNKVWSDAVQFSQGETAIVFAKELYAENTIELTGRGFGKAELLNRVVDTLDDINNSSKFDNLKVEKLIPCPCISCSTTDDTNFYSYEYLRRKLENGQSNAECHKSLNQLPIRDILREVKAFSIQEIEQLLAVDEMNKALNLMLGRFEEESEIIIQMARLSNLEKENRKGSLSFDDYSIEKNKIRDAILNKLNN